MKLFLPSLIVIVPILLAIFAGGAFVFAVMRFWQWTDDCKRRKSGLVRDLLRPAGQSCRDKIDDLAASLAGYLAALLLMPVVFWAFYLGDRPKQSTWMDVVCFVPPLLLASAFFGVKLFQVARERQRWMLGLDGELSVAEDLNLLMLKGCRVFHDVPAEYGNIDHVVVSPSGVFPVETKSRQKPLDGNGNARVEIDYDKGLMKFSDWTEPLPTDQIESQERWLRQWLSMRCNQPVVVEPMIAIPGWDVRRTGKKTVMVINPHNAPQFFLNSRRVISDDLAIKIADELTMRCRNLERVKKGKPRSY